MNESLPYNSCASNWMGSFHSLLPHSTLHIKFLRQFIMPSSYFLVMCTLLLSSNSALLHYYLSPLQKLSSIILIIAK